MSAKRITERVATPFAGVRVNRANSTISGVLLCGLRSENNRDYLPAALRRDGKKYGGKPVYCNHGREVTIERKIAKVLPEITYDADGKPYGTLLVNPKHPMAESLFWAAENDPSFYGMSHVAMCKTSYDQSTGREVVEAIDSVESIDLVADPATTKGLHESKSKGNPMFTIKKFLEGVAHKATVPQILKVKRLAEMEGMADLPMPEPAAEEPVDDGIWSAFVAAVNKVIDGLEGSTSDPAAVKAALGKIKKLLSAHGDINGDGKVDDADVAAAGDSDDMTAESKKKGSGAAILEALSVAEKVGLKADRSDLEIIAAVPVERRESVAKKLLFASSVSGSSKPKSTPRGAGYVQESQDQAALAKPNLDEGWIC